MIDLNDPQLDEHGKNAYLLTNQTFKHQIETDCRGDGNSSLKDAKYIYRLEFGLNIAELFNNEPKEKRFVKPSIGTWITNPFEDK